MRKEYLNYHFNERINMVLPDKFRKKYHVILYAENEDTYLCISDRQNDYFLINNLTLILKKQVTIYVISDVEYEFYEKQLDIYINKDLAIKTINNLKNKELFLKEENDFIYDADINNSPVVKIVDTIIDDAIISNASDIHIEPSISHIDIRYRIDGKLIDKNVLDLKIRNDLSNRIKILANLDITKKTVPQDGKFTYEKNDFHYDVRVSIMPGVCGEIIVLRLLYKDKQLIKLDELKLPSKEEHLVRKMINASSGLIIVAGPTGSGKSTTLETFLLENTEKNVNIISIEDPVEYTISKVNQVQINPEAGTCFSTILKSVVRQDPNIIMVGEIRDVETGILACQAAITGHLIYSTLHSATSFGVVGRLEEMGVKRGVLIDSLRGIISQRLVRVLCEYCKCESEIQDSELGELKLVHKFKVYKACGCGKCNMTGYKGRIGVFEIISFTDDMKDELHHIRTKKEFDGLLKEKEVKTLRDYGIDLLKKGITSVEEIINILN